jgi:sugar lactone lactonase YvrE
MRDLDRYFALAFTLGIASLPSIADADILAASLGPNFADGSVPRLEDDGTPIPGGGIPQFSGGIGLPGGVTIGPDGNIYVASLNPQTGAGEVLFFDRETRAPLSSPHVGGRDGLFGTMPFNPPSEPGGDPVAPSPARLAFGPDGNLYVADMAGASVRIFDGQTGVLQPDTLNNFSGPTGLTFGPDGALYVGNFNTATIDRVVNGVKTTFVAQATSPLNTPSSMIILATGDMIVVDLIGNQLLKYNSSGTYVPSFDEEMNPVPFAVIPPPIPDPLPPGANFPTNSPSDVMFDADGNLLVGVLGITYPPTTPGAILRYDLEGNLLETVIDDVLGISSLAFLPADDAIAGDYDSNGQVELTDYEKWQADFGKWVAKGGGADGNGDGIVNAADYAIWRDNYTPVLEGSAAIPEPATGALALVVLLTSSAFASLRSW